MRISTKCRYGSKAIVEIAKNYGVKPTKRKDIAAHQHIPDSYLENILIELKNSGIITSIRGAKGGFVLNHPPAEVSMLDIINVLQGQSTIVKCVNNPAICELSKACVTRYIWQDMHDAQEKVLKRYTVDKLIEMSLDETFLETEAPVNCSV